MLQKPEIGAGMMGHLARMKTFPCFYLAFYGKLPLYQATEILYVSYTMSERDKEATAYHRQICKDRGSNPGLFKFFDLHFDQTISF